MADEPDEDGADNLAWLPPDWEPPPPRYGPDEEFEANADHTPISAEQAEVAKAFVLEMLADNPDLILWDTKTIRAIHAKTGIGFEAAHMVAYTVFDEQEAAKYDNLS